MKKSIVLFVIFTIIFAQNSFANLLSSDTLARNRRVGKVSQISKEIVKKPEAMLSAEEKAFQEEITAYYNKKYSNPLQKLESKLEKVIVVDAEGNTVLEKELTDHKVHDATLPVGAVLLMTRGNIVYYMVIK
jgi:uncharacterized protein YnzC (UPF0291/DUF896 family)